MLRRLVPLTIVTLWGVVILPLPQKAIASTPLTRAVVRRLHNWVQLMPRNRPKRRAKRRDTMIPGDGLATGRASLADLRFNDGSLARIGERAVFKFLPRTRTFSLSNGTVLLLIPPGQGKTRVRTRSAGATIRGSALFVRYDEQTDTTVVGSLTDSGIEVFNKDESRSQVLKAGQLIVVVKGRIQGLYNFDLRTFYDTSDLVRGLDLTQPSKDSSSDPAMARVQEETSEAVTKQKPIVSNKVVENPSFIELSSDSSDLPGEEVVQNDLPVKSLVDSGEIIGDTPKRNEDKLPNSNNPITPQTPGTPPTNGGENPTTPQTPGTPPTNGGENPTTPQTPGIPPTNGGENPTTPQTPGTPPTNGGENPTKPQTPGTPPTNGGENPTTPQTPGIPPTNGGENPTTPQTPVTPPTNGGENPPKPEPEPPVPEPPAPEPPTPEPPKPEPPAPEPPTPEPPKPEPPKPEPPKPEPPTPEPPKPEPPAPESPTPEPPKPEPPTPEPPTPEPPTPEPPTPEPPTNGGGNPPEPEPPAPEPPPIST